MKHFIFANLHGTYAHGMVQWGGMRFQIEAASVELRIAIEGDK